MLADTHGRLLAGVEDAFEGVSGILHAGDVGDMRVLECLGRLAPVVAVCGNIEPDDVAQVLPREAAGVLCGVPYVVAHKRKRLFKDLASGTAGALLKGELPALVVWGHDHVPSASWVDGVLYLDPGTATAPDDEDDDPTCAVVEVRPSGLAVTFVPLDQGGATIL